MLICEAAADYKVKGMTLYEGLTALYEKYGYYQESLETVTMKGIDGAEKINKIMSNFRYNALPIEVIDKIDYRVGIDNLPKSNVLKFIIENGWFAIRPSGTEPKIKFYFGVCSDSYDKSKKDVDKLINLVKSSISDVTREE